MQTGGKIDLLIEKIKYFWPVNFSTKNTENRAKICQWPAEIIWCEYKHGGA